VCVFAANGVSLAAKENPKLSSRQLLWREHAVKGFLYDVTLLLHKINPSV
jgi:hypothetical protein